jgi:hypothetical protein
MSLGANPSAEGNPSLDNSEVSMDIELAIAMAPGLQNVYVYEGPSYGSFFTSTGLNMAAYDMAAAAVFNAIASPTPNAVSNQVSSSWGLFDGSNIVQALLATQMQGQSVFFAVGDDGAFVQTNNIWSAACQGDGLTVPCGNSVPPPLAHDPFCPPTSTNCFDAVNLMTVVGGTQSAAQVGLSCLTETTWNDSSEVGLQINGGPGGGGICSGVGLPTFQPASLMTSANNGSVTARNIPDVSALADGVWVVSNNGQQDASGGTSAAAPLWAGFTALVNQQRANATPPMGPIGFANQYLYNIGQQATQYAADFHDVTTGNNNPNPSDSAHFSAVAGYDLATGWGSPRLGLLNDLASPAPLLGPLTYDLVNFVFVVGTDDLRCTSEAIANLYDVNGVLMPPSPIELHKKGDGSWDKGSTQSVLAQSLPSALPVTAIATIQVGLIQHSDNCQFFTSSDNWNIARVDVFLSSSTSSAPDQTILDLAFGTGQAFTMGQQVRLKDHGNGQPWFAQWPANFACSAACIPGSSPCGVQADCGASGASGGVCVGGNGTSGSGSGCCVQTSLECQSDSECTSGNCASDGSGDGSCQ